MKNKTTFWLLGALASLLIGCAEADAPLTESANAEYGIGVGQDIPEGVETWQLVSELSGNYTTFGLSLFTLDQEGDVYLSGTYQGQLSICEGADTSQCTPVSSKRTRLAAGSYLILYDKSISGTESIDFRISGNMAKPTWVDLHAPLVTGSSLSKGTTTRETSNEWSVTWDDDSGAGWVKAYAYSTTLYEKDAIPDSAWHEVSSAESVSLTLDFSTSGETTYYIWVKDGNQLVSDAMAQTVEYIAKASSVTLGPEHGCAIRIDGTVACSGTSPGNGYSSRLLGAAQVSGLNAATALALGQDFSCALQAGEVYCWGYNKSGVLGLSTTGISTLTPQKISGLSSVAEISAGTDFACARTSSGNVSCWGAGGYGQLGGGSYTDSSTPVDTGITAATQISCGDEFCCALVNSSPYCWGRGDLGQLGNAGTANSASPVAVATNLTTSYLSAGANHVCVRNTSSNAYCWGMGTLGQLGCPNTYYGCYGGNPYSNASAPRINYQANSSRGFVNGGDKLCFIGVRGSTSTGTYLYIKAVYCLGSNAYGELGSTSGGYSYDYTKVTDMGDASKSSDVSAYSLVVGPKNVCYVDSGSVYCWGNGAKGVLANESTDSSTSAVLTTY